VQISSKFLERASEQLATLPGIGRRTALRLALDLHKRTPEDIHEFVQTIIELKTKTYSCTNCGNLSDSPECGICQDENRNHTIICVVEDIRDIMAIENTGIYKGGYHVLGGVISPMDGIGPKDLNIDTLVERAAHSEIEEIIFAVSPTMEGDTTNFYLLKRLFREGVKFTTLSRGVSVGAELQFADEITLSRSLEQRQEFKLAY